MRCPNCAASRCSPVSKGGRRGHGAKIADDGIRQARAIAARGLDRARRGAEGRRSLARHLSVIAGVHGDDIAFTWSYSPPNGFLSAFSTEVARIRTVNSGVSK